MADTKWNEAMIKDAVKDGALDKLRAAHAAGLFDVPTWKLESSFRDANRDILLWANSAGLLGNNALGILTSRDLDTLKWAASHGFSGGPYTSSAARDNDYEKLEWILASGYGWHPSTASAATKHHDMLKFVIAKGCPWDGDSACRTSMLYGQLDALKWAVENGCPWTKETFEKPSLSSYRNRLGIKDYIDELFAKADRLEAEKAAKVVEEKALADEIKAEERDVEAFVKAKEKEIADRKAAGHAKILLKKAALDKLMCGEYRIKCGDVRRVIEMRYTGQSAVKKGIRQDRSLTHSQKTRMCEVWEAACSGIHAGTPTVINMAEAEAFVVNAPRPDCLYVMRY